MYTPTRFTAKNFRSYEKLDIEIKENSLTFIEGYNVDIGASSNGSGKSSIVKGIGWCLTGQTDKSVSAKQYIRKGADNCETNLYLHNARLSEYIRVRRMVGRKRAGKVEIFLNEKLVGDAYDAKSAQKWLEDKIGISFKDINQFLFISQENRFSFLTATDGERKRVIGSIAGFDVLDQKYYPKAADAYKKYDEKLSGVTSEINKLEARLEVYQEMVESYIEPKDYTEDIEKADLELTKAKNAVANLQEKQVTLVLKKPEEDDISDLLESLESEKKLFAKCTKDVIDIGYKISSIDSRISNSTTTCPSCKTEFGLGFDLSKLKKQKNELEKELAQAKSRESECSSNLKKVNSEVEQAHFDKEAKFSVYKKGIEANQALNEAIHEGREVVRLREGALNAILNNQKSADQKREELKKTKEKISSIEYDISTKTKEQEKLSHQVSELQYWKSALSASGEFRSHLARRALMAIEHQINSFLKEFNIGMSIEVEGYSQKSNGDLSDKISIEVIKDNGERMSVEECSGGQQARLNICSIVAMAQFINSRNNTEGLSLILLDEVMDSLDSHGIRSSERVLRDLGDLSVLAISHQPAFGQTSNKISVVYENGISTATQN